MKLLKKYPIIFVIFYCVWIFLIVNSYQLFSEIKDFVTVGASTIVQALEFTNFRAKELVIQFIVYFIVISLNGLYAQIMWKHNKGNMLTVFIGINFIFIIGYIYISNIFWPVSLILFFISYIVIWSSYIIYQLFIDKQISYDEGDIIFTSSEYPDKDTAQRELHQQLDKFKNENNLSYIVGEIHEDDEGIFYYVIKATQAFQIDKKELS